MSQRHSQSARSPPRTPQHQLRSNNNSFASNSSGSTYRVEEDAVIFELGARWLRAGFEGESEPKCIVGFGPEESRRAGDYRGYLKGTAAAEDIPIRPAKPEDWAKPYELWKMDLRDIDLGLVEDKIERAVRETYNKYLLADAGVARLVLVLPSVIPHPLLSSVLTTLFNRWRFPSITLLTSATMATTAAGLRSALVVDIGWAETVVTGVYEYREVATKRTTRAMKSLIQETGRLITRISTGEPQPDDAILVDFEYCEEVASRFLWCKPSRHLDEAMAGVAGRTVSIPSPSDPGSSYLDIPFSNLTEPVEKVLFAESIAESELDDEEKPISGVVYNTLLNLPPDVRGICMSRIVFIGGGSKIAGVRRRVLNEVAYLVEQYGWSPVRGKVIDRQIQKLRNLRLSRQHPPTPSETQEQTASGSASETGYETADEPETEIDPIEQKLQRGREKDVVRPVQGILREIETLGAWAGASLLTSLKVRGHVEIEREKYLQHGLAGASREWDHNHRDVKDSNLHSQLPDRRSGLRSGGDRSSWTLAGWG
ncbi:putative actin-related protein RO7 [Aspergillus lucknowensis]|uniref:Actin-related protein RO7 n=1 Tax=Aspergillus lucknowensis TaxID=176173 RepID=A0ABR4L6R8_9EURO